MEILKLQRCRSDFGPQMVAFVHNKSRGYVREWTITPYLASLFAKHGDKFFAQCYVDDGIEIRRVVPDPGWKMRDTSPFR